MFPSSKTPAYTYDRLAMDDLEEDLFIQQHHQLNRCHHRQHNQHYPTINIHRPVRSPSYKCSSALPVSVAACSLSFLLVGFFLGQGFALNLRELGLTNSLVLPVEPHMFRYDPLYGGRPSNRSDEAWNGLLPKRGGFFNHPKIAPERGSFAVFHQLHCLNSLRQAYWTTLDAALSPAAMSLESIPFEISPSYMRHCIDLLRQALICSPDLTVEIKNTTLGGVTGFGTMHKCRDWDGLMGWVEKWEDVGAPRSFDGGVEMGHAHHHGM